MKWLTVMYSIHFPSFNFAVIRVEIHLNFIASYHKPGEHFAGARKATFWTWAFNPTANIHLTVPFACASIMAFGFGKNLSSEINFLRSISKPLVHSRFNHQPSIPILPSLNQIPCPITFLSSPIDGGQNRYTCSSSICSSTQPTLTIKFWGSLHTCHNCDICPWKNSHPFFQPSN